MKTILKSTLMFFAAALFISATANFVYAQPGAITAPPGTSMIPSDYVDTTLADDPVFIFCSPNANGDSILGSLSIAGGTAVCNFEWSKFDPDPASPTYNQFIPFFQELSQASSTVTELQSGLYRVKVTQNPGMPNEAIFCRRAHVYVNETEVNFDSIPAGCQPFSLTGGVVSSLNDFVVYDSPPCPFIVDSTTQIKVCFWANHTYVSDLGFYLVDPSGNRVDLQPPIPVWNQGQQVTLLDISVVTGCAPNDYYTNCNSGNDVNNYCFLSVLPAGNPTMTPCICDMNTPLTGIWSSCGFWNHIYGSSASSGGWQVMIYDGQAGDVGYLQKVTLTFIGQSACGMDTVEYDSGPINVPINDYSFSPTTATTYTFPLVTPAYHTITNEVTAEWSCFPGSWNPAWGLQSFLTNPFPNIDPPPLQSTTFCLTAIDHLYDTSGVEITSSSYPQYQACELQVCHEFENLQADATILSYPNYICQNDLPYQLIPLNSGGVWSSNSGTWPSGPIDTSGVFYPNLALLGDNIITYSFTGVCGDQQSVIINVVDAPVVTYLQETSNGSSTHFQLSFTVVGGNPGSYEFLNCADSTNFPGSYMGTTFTSGWIPCSTPYCFIVKDNWSCNPVIVQGYNNCYCSSSSGDMPTVAQYLCSNEQTNVQVLNDTLGNPTYTLDANDGFEYFLHDYQFGYLGNIYDHNITGIFQFLPTMVYNHTYYISQVVGNNIGTTSNNIVDLSDTCLSVSQGTPVIWQEMPVVYAGVDDTICGTEYQFSAIPGQGTGWWTCPVAAQFSDSTSPQSNVLIDPLGNLVVSTYFSWNEYLNGCIGSDSVLITFLQPPFINAGYNDSVVGDTYNLNATSTMSVGWWEGPTGSVFSNPTSPQSAVQIDFYGLSEVTADFTWSEQNLLCTVSDDVTIVFINANSILDLDPLISGYQLYQNIPNPFCNETEISFYLPKKCAVEISIYNLLGKKVSEIISEERPKGKHSITFSNKDLSAGTYFYRLKTTEFEQTRKMVVIK